MAHKMATKVETLTGTRTLASGESKAYYTWHLDPGGADRTVQLPSESALSGHLLHIFNTADDAEALTVVASDGTTVLGTLVRGADVLLSSDGTSWRFGTRRREKVLVETLAGARVLTAAEVLANPVMAFDPGGAGRTVDLPVTTDLAGVSFTVINTADAAETLTVRLTSGGATVGTVDQNENATFICYSATAGSWVAQVGKAT